MNREYIPDGEEMIETDMDGSELENLRENGKKSGIHQFGKMSLGFNPFASFTNRRKKIQDTFLCLK